MSELKNKVVKGAIWTLFEKVFGQAATFVVSMVLARLLTPGDYGTVALLSIFMSIAGTIVGSGLGLALVQKKDATELHFNSMFYTSLALATIAYIVLFSIAPLVAKFYAIPELKAIMRVVSLTIVFHAINAVQDAYLTRELLFDLRFRISVITTVTSAATGISLALLGFGVWALVMQGMFAGIVGVVAKWIIIAWRPKLMFSWVAIGELFDYGWKMLGMNLIANIVGNVYGVIIGKSYGRSDLAYVNKGQSFPSVLTSSISSAVFGVSLPALAKMQDSKASIRSGMSKMMQCSTFVIFPIMTWLAVSAHDVVLLLFGNQWLPAVIYMQLMCFTTAMTPIADMNMQGMAATGKTGYFIPMQLIKSFTMLTVLVISLRYSVLLFVCVQCIFCKLFEIAVNSWPNRKLFEYPIEAQLWELVPTVVAILVMAAVMSVVRMLLMTFGFNSDSILDLITRIALQASCGVIAYLIVSLLLHVFAFRQYLEIVSPVIGKKIPLFSKFSTWYLENR